MSSKYKPEGADKGTWISMYIDEETNILLNQAKDASQRTKRAECQLRLRDHLKSYVSIASEGQRIEREAAE